jgi:hypothetical protein
MRKEKKSKSGIIMALIIAFIMVGSILGYVSIGRQDNQFKYNGIKFTQTSNQWRTTINNQQLTFDYFPSDVEQIELSNDMVTALLNKPEIDTTSDLNDTFSEEIALANYNMALTLNKLNIYVMGGFTTNNTFNLPILTCKGSTQAVPIIYFKQSNQTKITLENNCIIAEAKNNIDILRIKDRLLYSMLGIIK